MASNNWQSLKRKISNSNEKDATIKKRTRNSNELNNAVESLNTALDPSLTEPSPVKTISNKIKCKYVALDCEMVGIGIAGKHSALARCSMVDFDGIQIYDKHVRPQGYVTDFRTKWSGIRKKDLRASHAISLQQCQEEVAQILKDKILVGHALKNDLSVLMLSHSKTMIRDTARFRPYMRPHGKKGGKFRPRALRDLAKQHFGMIIQAGEHDSCEDARVAMLLYKQKMEDWEKSLKDRSLRNKAKALQKQEDDKER